MNAPLCTVTPLEALRRLYDVARKVDAKESGEFETLLQGELLVAETALRVAAPVVPAGQMPPDHDAMVSASLALSPWLAAALDDTDVCNEYKTAIAAWFNAAMPSATIDAFHARIMDTNHILEDQLAKVRVPVVPVAAQPVVPEGWKLVPEEPTAEMFDAVCKIDNDMFAGGSAHGAEDSQVWAAMYDAVPAAPQPAASVTDVAKDAARFAWLIGNVVSGSIGFGDWWINADEPAEEWRAAIDTAIAAQQGEKNV